MFDIAPTEFLLVAVVALVVIGPKDLPRVMRTVGKWAGRARGVVRQFRSSIDTMIHESELADLKKKWEEENERIMREFPSVAALPAPPTHWDGQNDVVPAHQEEASAAPSEAAAKPKAAAAKPRRKVAKPKTTSPPPEEVAPPAKPARVRKPKVKAD